MTAELALGFVEIVRCKIGGNLTSLEAILLRSGMSPTAAAGGFDADTLTFFQTSTELSRHPFGQTVFADDRGLPRCARLAAGQTPWPAGAAVCQQSYIAVCQHFNLTHDAIATAMFPGSPPIPPKRGEPNR